MSNEVQLDSLIKKMAQEHRLELPSSGVVWWRAQIQKKLAEKERVERPMMVMRLAAIVASTVVFVGVLAANWPQFLSVTRSNTPLLLVLTAAATFALMTGFASFFRSAPRT